MEVFNDSYLFKLILKNLQYNDAKNLRICRQLKTIPYPIDINVKGMPIKYYEMNSTIFRIIDAFLKYGIINGITNLIKTNEYQCATIAMDIWRKSIQNNHILRL